MHEPAHAFTMTEETAETPFLLDGPSLRCQPFPRLREHCAQIGTGRNGLALEDLTVQIGADEPVGMGAIGERIVSRAASYHESHANEAVPHASMQ
jgi:hypothetical protein